MKKHMNKGFTLIESLFSLIVITLGMSLLVMVLPQMKKINEYNNDMNEEMGLIQLREMILLSTEILFYEDELRFYYNAKDVSLIIDGDRVVRTDGYVIYLEDLEYPYFSEEGTCYYLNYEKDHVEKKRFLGCE